MNAADERVLAARIPRRLLVLTAAQLVLAGLALYLDLAEACSGCRTGGALRPWIAAAGVLGYGTLLALGWAGRAPTFYVGIFTAMGVHVALATAMLVSESFCPVCAASAVIGITLGYLAFRLFSDRSPYTTTAAAVLTLLIVLPGALDAKERASQRHRLTGGERHGGEVIVLDVIESVRCSYCRAFRKSYLPRLREDFGASVDVRFHDAKAVPWVERTPTFLLNGVPVFEGLPHRYEDLREVLETSRSAQ